MCLVSEAKAGLLELHPALAYQLDQLKVDPPAWIEACQNCTGVDTFVCPRKNAKAFLLFFALMACSKHHVLCFACLAAEAMCSLVFHSEQGKAMAYELSGKLLRNSVG